MTSGKFVLRAGADLHSRLRKEADERGLSLNALVVEKLGAAQSTSPLVDLLRSTLGKSFRALIVFGSEARGERRANSDIDFLIVLDRNVAIDRSLYAKWSESIERMVDQRCSPHFSHLPDPKAPSSLWLEVALEGQVLHDDLDHATRRVLTAIRDKIAAGEFKRKMSHGHPYWTRD